jgi:hypothetical protein
MEEKTVDDVGGRVRMTEEQFKRFEFLYNVVKMSKYDAKRFCRTEQMISDKDLTNYYKNLNTGTYKVPQLYLRKKTNYYLDFDELGNEFIRKVEIICDSSDYGSDMEDRYDHYFHKNDKKADIKRKNLIVTHGFLLSEI